MSMTIDESLRDPEYLLSLLQLAAPTVRRTLLNADFDNWKHHYPIEAAEMRPGLRIVK